MKFSEMPYQRPDPEKVKTALSGLTERLKAAETYAEAKAVFLEKEEQAKDVDTLGTLAQVRHTIDTRDAFYEAENEFWDSFGPEIEEYEQAWLDAMLASPFRKDFAAEYGRDRAKSVLTRDHPRDAEGERTDDRIQQTDRVGADPVRRRRLYAVAVDAV